VYDPEGRTVTRVQQESPAVVVADLDADEVLRAQAANPVEDDRLDALGPRTRVLLS
jgi:predicted amidohydrolase